MVLNFYSLILASYQFVNKVVVSAFVERWYRETSTFHISFKEMTIILDDISSLLGIPIVCRPVSSCVEKLSNMDVVILVVNKPVVSSQQAAEELIAIWGQSLQM